MAAIHGVVARQGVQLFYACDELRIAARGEVAPAHAFAKEGVARKEAVFGKVANPARGVPRRGDDFEVYARGGDCLTAAERAHGEGRNFVPAERGIVWGEDVLPLLFAQVYRHAVFGKAGTAADVVVVAVR